MRLLDTQTKKLEELPDSDSPPYAILSHRWQKDEVTFDDMNILGTDKSKRFGKISAFCDKASSLGLRYAWADACCINRSNSSELAEAINSMFTWYSKAAICLAYLSDIRSDDIPLKDSEWFERGWTLQELIAPARVNIYNSNWENIGTKESLREILADITGIDEGVLAGENPLERSIAQRMAWAASRKTTRIEDKAYSLLGLFDISLPMIYGEGDKAFLRLQEEIIKHSDDHSIFAWNLGCPEASWSPCGLFAPSPSAFAECEDIIRTPSDLKSEGYAMTNRGLSIYLHTTPYGMNTYLALLNCTKDTSPTTRLGITLERLSVQQYRRVRLNQRGIELVNSTMMASSNFILRHLLVRQNITSEFLDIGYGFWLRSLDLIGFESHNLNGALIFSKDDKFPYSESMPLVRIPVGLSGTAGVALLPPQRRFQPHCRVYYMKFGFDDEFRPLCLLGNERYLWCRSAVHPTDYERGFRSSCVPSLKAGKRLFENHWISQANKPKSEPENQNFCIVKGGGTFEIPFLDVQISVSLQRLPENLVGDSPFSSWWTVDVIGSRPPVAETANAIVEPGEKYSETDFISSSARATSKPKPKL